MANWSIPDNFADILPRQARCLEAMRRASLDLFASHGFELVQPPMVEFVDSLLTGTGSDVSNNTFRFMDQSGGGGRMIGLRADMTPQIARIDAHILNRPGVTRLCYAGSVLHARPMHPLASREPVVAGAEIFGASGLDTDLQIMRLAVETLRTLGVQSVHLDIGHTAVVRALIGENLNDEGVHSIVRALRTKDPVALEAAAGNLSAEAVDALQLLMRTFGDVAVLDELAAKLPQKPEILAALEEVRVLSRECGADEVSFDFCDVHGYQYLTGITFAAHLPQSAQAVLRGGRYDGVGLAFGRSRPACGFTVYLRILSDLGLSEDRLPECCVVRGRVDSHLAAYVASLRKEGRAVVCLFEGESPEDLREQFRVTHEVVRTADGFALAPL